jgi:hypothetical protein
MSNLTDTCSNGPGDRVFLNHAGAAMDKVNQEKFKRMVQYTAFSLKDDEAFGTAKRSWPPLTNYYEIDAGAGTMTLLHLREFDHPPSR